MSNLLNALKRKYEADIACAKANISVYVEPVSYTHLTLPTKA